MLLSQQTLPVTTNPTPATFTIVPVASVTSGSLVFIASDCSAIVVNGLITDAGTWAISTGLTSLRFAYSPGITASAITQISFVAVLTSQPCSVFVAAFAVGGLSTLGNAGTLYLSALGPGLGKSSWHRLFILNHLFSVSVGTPPALPAAALRVSAVMRLNLGVLGEYPGYFSLSDPAVLPTIMMQSVCLPPGSQMPVGVTLPSSGYPSFFVFFDSLRFC